MLLIVNAASIWPRLTEQVASTDASDTIAARSKRQRGCKRFRERIGRIAETQEMLDFCGEHGITPAIEVIRMDQVNGASERMLRSDAKYCFAIDMASLSAA